MEGSSFENINIRKDAISISNVLFYISEKADEKMFYKFAEQLRVATMNISNNIAEASDSFSDNFFASLVNITRRSVFECAIFYRFFYSERL